MTYLYLDIETIPSQNPAVHAMIAESIAPPGNISKAETIAAWEADKKPALVKEAIAKTSFDGAMGHVCCIGFAWGRQMPDCSYTTTAEPAHEKTIMLDFFSSAPDDVTKGLDMPIIVGHYVSEFDIRFIWQRAIVLGLRVPSWFPRDPRPWSGMVFDTMTAFAGARNRISLDALCRALGIKGKDDIDGSMIADMWARGEQKAIAQYCRDDVEKTRAVHRKMMVAFGQGE